MLIKLEQKPAQDGIEVLITYPFMNKTVERIVSLVKSAGTCIECYSGDGIKSINIFDIYYIESEDKKTVVYCKKENYRCKYRLYQIHEMLRGKGFVQISKNCILNLNKLDLINPLFNSRMEALLSNGTRLCVNRKYLAAIKQKLQENQ